MLAHLDQRHLWCSLTYETFEGYKLRSCSPPSHQYSSPAFLPYLWFRLAVCNFYSPITMWLLNTRSGKLKEFRTLFGLPRYAVLSHVWQLQEDSFQDIQALRFIADALTHAGPKIRGVCEVAREDGFEWVWIDTCCIDKSSSTELSEAINSMYSWYAQAAFCYAYLHDVEDEDDTASECSSFRASKWFTRGWTLQELIAPRDVAFLSFSWSIIGTKDTLAAVVEEITGIDHDVLTHTQSLEYVSIARRMSWAAYRQTTREEDLAYSLMGLFGVHMPTIYGEGRNAFLRLQEEILKRSPDQTLFAWGRRASEHLLAKLELDETHKFTHPGEEMLASSPTDFRGCSGITPIPHSHLAALLDLKQIELPEFRLSSYGIRVNLRLVGMSNTPCQPAETPRRFKALSKSIGCCAILACVNEHKDIGVLFLRLQPPRTFDNNHNGDFVGAHVTNARKLQALGSHAEKFYRLAFISPKFARSIFAKSQVREINVRSFATNILLSSPSAILRPLLVAMAISAPRYAFFISKRGLANLRNAGLQVDSSRTQTRDGLMIEMPCPRSECGESEELKGEGTVSFTLKTLSSSSSDGADSRITVTVGEECSETKCVLGPWHAHSHRSSVPSKRKPAWLAVSVHSTAPDGASTDPNLVPKRFPCLDATLAPRAAHIPDFPTFTLAFVDWESHGLVYTITMSFQLWERCHRSVAEQVYMLDISAAGTAIAALSCVGDVSFSKHNPVPT